MMLITNNILETEKLLDEIDGVDFDLDDTLYSEKDYVRSGYRAIAAAYPEISGLEEKLWAVFLAGKKAIDEVFAAEGLTEKRQDALALYRSHTPDIHLYEGVEEMLSRIRKGRQLGIITDGRPEGQRAKIGALGLEADVIIITDELGGIEYRKPNEAAFLLMQQRMNIPFEKMVYIGDNPDKDFVAPEKLGMKCILFRNREGLYSNTDIR